MNKKTIYLVNNETPETTRIRELQVPESTSAGSFSGGCATRQQAAAWIVESAQKEIHRLYNEIAKMQRVIAEFQPQTNLKT
jgi:hypothetical protein